MAPRRSTRGQKAPVQTNDTVEEAPSVKSKKQKPPTNKERFEFLEQQLAQVTEALGRLTTTQLDSHPPPLSAPPSLPDVSHTPSLPHLSRASTPKRSVPVRQALTNKELQPPGDTSLLAGPLFTNVDILNSEETKRHVDHVTRSTAARQPRSAGKPTYDVYLNKVVGYEMPRHFIGAHSQRRVRGLDSHDDLSLPEFVQGYVSMIMRVGLDIPTSEAMTRCLGLIGEALIDYQWEDIRDWINSVLHDVGQGRITWLDDKVITERLNAAKMRASMRPQLDASIPVCALSNQGKCPHDATHGIHRHICVVCWISAGVQHAHPLPSCRRRNSNLQHGNNGNRQPQGDYNNRQGSHYHNSNHGRQTNTQFRGRQGSYDNRSQGNDNQSTSLSKN